MTVVVSLTALACSPSPDGATHPARSEASQAAPLKALPKINMAGQIANIATPVLSQVSGRLIAQVRSGPDYLLAYTTGKKCGLLALRPGSPNPVQINITENWPAAKETGHGNLPGGPYLIATAPSATTGGYVKLHCGAHSEVVEYSVRSDETHTAKPSTVGSISVVSSTGQEPLVVAIGSSGSRDALARHFGMK
ncbi:hypothetical protein [Streptomyces albidocamelliae]|uniref:Lipoprotein n=1 Tax=Streptomyces albidocamelliae TaxID=2981135 RepID=A0ABY6EG96_9ACTN|nr:hypothetical protein [Streptomyces sp. HUAS 14-6]UXY33317.1 hypothetical protein N8I86_00310 [Streptomyces sp. HUAS 14-6]